MRIEHKSVWRRSGSGALLACFGAVAIGCASRGVAPESPTPTLELLSGQGPYQVESYSEIPDVPEFGDATIFFPVDAPGRVGGVAIAPGFTERQSHIAWWGPRLASHGFAVLILDTNDPRERPEARADALAAALRTLKAEDARVGSPLLDKVDITKMAVMGHSMGGGGALIAANRLGRQVQAVIPFTPWQPEGNFGDITAPTLVIAASDDAIAPVAEHAWPHFQSLRRSVPRVYLEIDAGDHFVADTERGRDLATIGRYGIAWLKLYLDGDERYRTFLYGPAQRADRDRFSRYVAEP